MPPPASKQWSTRADAEKTWAAMLAMFDGVADADARGAGYTLLCQTLGDLATQLFIASTLERAKKEANARAEARAKLWLPH